jgi:biotin transport system permease protein
VPVKRPAEQQSTLSRVRPGIRFGFLFVAGIALYLITSPLVLACSLAVAVVALLLTRASASELLRPVLGLVIIIGVVVIMTGFTLGWSAALVSGLRLMTLCLFAYAISLATRFAEMLDVFERLLRPTRRLGLDPARISLALSLTVRFIPEIRTRYLQVREAQYARGLQHRPMATLVPLIIRTLQSAEQIAEAIDARCYDDVSTRSTRQIQHP